MTRPRILLICGSINQTTQMHQIARQLGECDCFFTNYYDDGYPDVLKRLRLTEATPLPSSAFEQPAVTTNASNGTQAARIGFLMEPVEQWAGNATVTPSVTPV